MLLEKPWRITLLGGLRAEQEGGPYCITRFQTAKTGSLLAYLAYYPRRTHSREQLMERFWPDGAPDASRLSLRVALASLRRQLEPPGILAGSVLQTRGNAYVGLNPDSFATDVAAFNQGLHAAARAASPPEKIRRLDEAIALYPGELLPGFYDDWILLERETLAQSCQDAIERLTDLRRQHSTEGNALAATTDEPEPSGETLSASAALRLPAVRLPLQMTRFFGREAEIARILGHLRQARDGSPHRLLTLTGPGGVGKTRLAVEAIRTLASSADACAAVFVSLADRADPALLVGAVADALPLSGASPEPLLTQVIRALSAPSAPTLLVLDNFEQLIAAGGAAVVQTLLESVPGLSCLVTSRQTLGIEGEVEIAVAPLPLPQQPDTPQRLLAFPSVQLFIDRARTARPDFQITVRNAPSIEALCRRLEGIPLALELAAARISVLTTAQMLERLEDGMDLLAGRHDRPLRHQTLRATMEWSYRLLDPALQLFFVSLAVFRGGWTLEAVEAVGPQTGSVSALDAMEQLRQRSLITTQEDSHDTALRFRLLETLREFADESLTETARAPLEQRHTEYYTILAETAEPHLRGAEQGAWLRRLEAEQDNFRTVRRWCAANLPDNAEGTAARVEYGLRLAGALWRFWMIRGYFQEGRAWLEESLTQGAHGPPAVRAKALNGLAGLACYQHDYAAARPLYEECLRLHQEGSNEKGIAATLNNMGLVATAQGDYETARSLCEQSLALRLEKNEDPHGIATALGNLGNIALFQEDYAAAQTYQERSLAVFRERGAVQSVALTLNALGATALGQGELAMARAHFDECLALYEGLGDTRGIAEVQHNLCAVLGQEGDTAEAWTRNHRSLVLRQQIGNAEGVISCLESFAGLLTQTQRWEQACRLFGTADALRTTAGVPLPPFTRRLHHRHLEMTRAVLGENQFQKGWREGRTWTLAQAVAQLPDAL